MCRNDTKFQDGGEIIVPSNKKSREILPEDIHIEINGDKIVPYAPKTRVISLPDILPEGVSMSLEVEDEISTVAISKNTLADMDKALANMKKSKRVINKNARNY